MQVYFTSDTHLGHRAITKYRSIFSTMEEHDNYMLSQLESLSKRSLVFILGDFLFDGPNYTRYLTRIANLPYRIKLIMGNHDTKKLYQSRPSNLELQLPLVNYKSLWLSHCPIHPQELRNRLGCVHGHLHLETLLDPRYFNVNIDVNDYKLVPLTAIKDHFKDNHD